MLRAAQSFSIDTAAVAKAFAPSLQVTRQAAEVLRAAQSFSIDTAAVAKAFAPSLQVTRQAAEVLRAAQSFSIDTAAVAKAFAPSLQVTRQAAEVLRAAQSFSIDTAAVAKAFAPSLQVTRQAAEVLRAAQSFSGVHTPTAPELDNLQTSAPPTRLEKLGELRKSLAREEALQRATASQIDELLMREVTSGVAGTCWGCGKRHAGSWRRYVHFLCRSDRRDVPRHVVPD